MGICLLVRPSIQWNGYLWSSILKDNHSEWVSKSIIHSCCIVLLLPSTMWANGSKCNSKNVIEKSIYNSNSFVWQTLIVVWLLLQNHRRTHLVSMQNLPIKAINHIEKWHQEGNAKKHLFIQQQRSTGPCWSYIGTILLD